MSEQIQQIAARLAGLRDALEITPEEISYYNDVVANKFLVSQWILEEDYWRILFGDNLPPDDLPHDPENPDGTISPESSNYYE